MIRRERDAELINRISNMEGVRQNVCYKDDPMDWAEVVAHPDIFVLSNGVDACGVFGMTEARVFQVHTVFSPQCRGKKAIKEARAMLAWMKPHAVKIWGATPLKNCAARWFNRQLGAMPIRRDHYEAEGEVEIFELELG